MPPRQTAGVILADTGEAQAKKSSPVFKKLMQGSGHTMAMGHANQSMREDLYKGHHIMVMTSYQVKIDGKVFKGKLSVSNSGAVNYHGIPNVGFDSAIDLVKSVIDVFPDEFPAKKGHSKSMPGMAKKAAKKPAKKKMAAMSMGGMD